MGVPPAVKARGSQTPPTSARSNSSGSIPTPCREQISSGNAVGAVRGDFKGRTTGTGPVLSSARKFRRAELVAGVKWLRELDAQRRPGGSHVGFKLALMG